jgi:probable phosphoglycerate mutase
VILSLVRHGESHWNELTFVQGQSLLAPGLTSQGRRESGAVAAQLTGVDRIIASDLQRAAETASIIADFLGIKAIGVDLRLRDRSFGVVEGRPIRDISPGVYGLADDRVADADAAPQGGESIRALYRRVALVIDELVAEASEEHVILVTHGGPIRVASAYVNGVNPQDMSWPPLDNASITRLELHARTRSASTGGQT